MVHWYLSDMLSKIRYLLITFTSLIIIITCFLIYQFYYFIYRTPLTVDRNGYVLVIPVGTSLQKVAKTLSQDGVLKHPTWFVVWVGLTGARGKLQAGEYLIKPGSTPASLVALLISGKVIQHAFTIVEGWNFSRLIKAINEEPHLKHTVNKLSNEEIMEKMGYPTRHPEGRFFPDTYYFTAGTTDVALLRRAYQQLQQKLAKAWGNRSADVCLKNAEEALILASIIEKESGFLEEYCDISGVYHRRLKLQMPLQADPTVIYGAGNTYLGKVTFNLLKVPSPYNTYLNAGLPPTPIALPSESALIAATHPREGDALYFVAKQTGRGHVFSKTLKEHSIAVGEYRQGVNAKQNIKDMPEKHSVYNDAVEDLKKDKALQAPTAQPSLKHSSRPSVLRKKSKNKLKLSLKPKQKAKKNIPVAPSNLLKRKA